MPRSSLILAIQRESKQIQALEKENRDLRVALEDHQNALELIMSKYRQQVSQLVKYNNACQRLHQLNNSNCCCHQTTSSNFTPNHKKQSSTQRKQETPSSGLQVPSTSLETNTMKQNKVYSNCSSKNTSPASSSGSSSVRDVSREREMKNYPTPVVRGGMTGNSFQGHLLNLHQEKIMEMAAVMMKAVDLDEAVASHDQELLAQLQMENQGLRELLEISRSNGNDFSRLRLQKQLHPQQQVPDESLMSVEAAMEVKETNEQEIQADLPVGLNGQGS